MFCLILNKFYFALYNFFVSNLSLLTSIATSVVQLPLLVASVIPLLCVLDATVCNWTSEASPTLGCSIEISRDIYMYVFDCLWENNTKKSYVKNAWAELRSPNTRMLKNQFWEFETKCRL